MDVFIFLFLIIVGCFAMVGFFGAPYVPTLSQKVEVALDLLDLRPGQTMIELGCGDGKVVLAAARRGLLVVGYELNPIMAVVSWLRTWRYRRQVRIVWGNFFKRTLPPADGIFCFIMPRFMPAIHQKILESASKPTRLASFAFAIPGVEPARRRDNVLLYLYK